MYNGVINTTGEVMSLKINRFLSLLRGDLGMEGDEEVVNLTAVPIMTEVFTQGNCRNLAEMLRMLMGEGEVVMVRTVGVIHAVYSYRGRLYDITGDVTDQYSLFVGGRLSSLDYSNYSWEDRGPAG